MQGASSHPEHREVFSLVTPQDTEGDIQLSLTPDTEGGVQLSLTQDTEGSVQPF